MISAALAILETQEERDCLSDFYKEYKNRLYNIAFSKLNDRLSAEDALMETFLKIADKPKKFFEIEPDKRVYYADVIVRNIAIDMYKKASHSPETELDEDLSDELINPSVERIVYGKISEQELIDCVLSLPQSQRDALSLKIQFDLSYSEIAEKLGISENTARQRIFQARKSITEFINKDV